MSKQLSRKAVPVVASLALLACVSVAAAQSGRVAHVFQTEQQCTESYDRLTGDGFVPVYQKVYVHGGVLRFDMSYERVENNGWACFYGLSSSDYNQKNVDYSALGYSRVSYNNYRLNGQLLHSAIWIRYP